MFFGAVDKTSFLVFSAHGKIGNFIIIIIIIVIIIIADVLSLTQQLCTK